MTLQEINELKRLRAPQLRVFATLAGATWRQIAARRTDDSLRLLIITKRIEREESK